MVRFIVEIINLTWYITIWTLNNSNNKNVLRRVSCMEVLKCIKNNYLSFFTLGALSNYTEYFGFEFNTVIILLTGNTDMLASWVCIMNVSHICRNIGGGFGATTNEILNEKIGKSEFLNVGKYSKMSLIVSLVYSILISVII